MFSKTTLILITFFATIPLFAQQKTEKNLADYVNTLQGTNSKFELTHGNTYPLPCPLA